MFSCFSCCELSYKCDDFLNPANLMMAGGYARSCSYITRILYKNTKKTWTYGIARPKRALATELP